MIMRGDLSSHLSALAAWAELDVGACASAHASDGVTSCVSIAVNYNTKSGIRRIATKDI